MEKIAVGVPGYLPRLVYPLESVLHPQDVSRGRWHRRTWSMVARTVSSKMQAAGSVPLEQYGQPPLKPSAYVSAPIGGRGGKGQHAACPKMKQMKSVCACVGVGVY